MTTIYFAHPKKTYGTELEAEMLEWLRIAFKGYRVLNPAKYIVEDGKGLEYLKTMQGFFMLIEQCELMVCMGNTDGVNRERIYAMEHGISVLNIPEGISD